MDHTYEFVKKLEKMLQLYGSATIHCPRSPNFSASEAPMYHEEDCALCAKFMGIPTDLPYWSCPCNYYGEEQAVELAWERITEYHRERIAQIIK